LWLSETTLLQAGLENERKWPLVRSGAVSAGSTRSNAASLGESHVGKVARAKKPATCQWVESGIQSPNRRGAGAISIPTYCTVQHNWHPCQKPFLTDRILSNLSDGRKRRRASWPPCLTFRPRWRLCYFTLQTPLRNISELEASITQRLSCWSEVSSTFLILALLVCS